MRVEAVPSLLCSLLDAGKALEEFAAVDLLTKTADSRPSEGTFHMYEPDHEASGNSVHPDGGGFAAPLPGMEGHVTGLIDKSMMVLWPVYFLYAHADKSTMRHVRHFPSSMTCASITSLSSCRSGMARPRSAARLAASLWV